MKKCWKLRRTNYYLGEFEIMQYLSNVRHNSAAPHAFVEEIVDMRNQTKQWDAKLAW